MTEQTPKLRGCRIVLPDSSNANLVVSVNFVEGNLPAYYRLNGRVRGFEISALSIYKKNP